MRTGSTSRRLSSLAVNLITGGDSSIRSRGFRINYFDASCDLILGIEMMSSNHLERLYGVI